MSRPSPITLEDCQSLFYLPVAQAATVLGVSRPTISKVLRAHGIKRWPYRKLRAEGKIEALRQRRESHSASVLPVLPPLPPPPPLPPFTIDANDNNSHQTHTGRNPQSGHSNATSLPLFPQPQPQQTTPDDETYILHLLDQPISPHQIEDHTHPFLSLDLQPEWTCDEQLSAQYPAPDHYPHLSQSPQPPPQLASQHHHNHRAEEDQVFHPDTRSHTISTVRPAARAAMGAGNWSRGVFKQNGDRMSFAFLPPAPMGSSLSDEDPLHANNEGQL